MRWPRKIIVSLEDWFFVIGVPRNYQPPSNRRVYVLAPAKKRKAKAKKGVRR